MHFENIAAWWIEVVNRAVKITLMVLHPETDEAPIVAMCPLPEVAGGLIRLWYEM